MQIKEFDCITINPSPLIPIAERKEIDYIDTSSVTEGRLEKVQHLISDFPSRAQREVVANDILISSVRPNLRHNYYVKATEDGMIASSGFIHLRVNDTATIDSKFLYYYLTSPFYTKYYTAIADCSQSSYPSFNKDVIEDIVFPNISSKRQKRIAKVLSGLDDKIALNRKKIEKLEALAKTIYDYWFVQFDFPDANGRPYKSSGGKMVYNPILKREIPDGWEVSGIEDMCSVVDCLHTKKPCFQHECDDSYLLTLENLTKSGYVDLSKKFYISSDDYREWTKNIEIKENDFVITNAGRAGDVVRVPKGVKCAAGRNMTVVRPLTIDPYYLAGFFKSPMMEQQLLNGLEEGSFFLNFNVRTIRKLKVLLPQDAAVRDALPIFGRIIKSVDAKRDAISKLMQTRDFLLPLLMNGQVEVGE